MIFAFFLAFSRIFEVVGTSVTYTSNFINTKKYAENCVGTTVTDTNTKGKPTNSEFIALIADKLQLQMKTAGAVNF